MFHAYLNPMIRLLAAERWIWLLAAISLGTVFSVAERYDNGFILVDNIILFAAEVVFMHRLLIRGFEGGASARPRMMRLFGASLMTGAAVLVGFVLLIVPGLILIARWRLAWPLIMTRDMPILEALRTSWTLTSGQTLPLVGATLILWLPALLMLFVLLGFIVMDTSFVAALWFDVVMNLTFVATALADCALSVAVHHRLASSLDGGSDNPPDSRVYA